MISMMVIDDEQGICDFISDFFQRRGHQVTIVTDPTQAVDKVQEKNPQVILLDIIMKGLTGLEVLEKIRQVNKNVKIIMVTVADDEQTREKAFALGADDYVIKPFNTDYLEAVVMKKIQELLN